MSRRKQAAESAEVVNFPAEPTDDEQVMSGWSEPIDLGPALKGDPPPGPSVCRWTVTEDKTSITRALFYANEVHSVFGEPESMKSWLLLHAAAEEVKDHQHVLYLDLEANDRSIVARLRALGVTKKALRQRFHYFRPSLQINHDDHTRIAEMVTDWEPTLVVLDGVTEAFAMNNWSINSPEDAALWLHHVTRRFQVRSGDANYEGPAIVELDHVVKARENRGGWAIGSQHKKAGIKGAAYQVESVRPFGRERHGISRLILEKDSPGGVSWQPFGQDRVRLVAEFHAESESDGSVETWLDEPDLSMTSENALPLADTQKFRDVMPEVREYVRKNPECSLRSVRDHISANAGLVGGVIEELLRLGELENRGNEYRKKLVIRDATDV